MIGSDKHIVNRISRGDKKAFSRIFESNYRLMYAIARKYLKDDDRAMDAVQNAFIRLWEKRTELDRDTNLHNLLYTILKNGILNEIRNNRLHYEKLYQLAQQQNDTSYELFQENGRERLAKLLRNKIKTLPLQQRAICELKLNENLSNMEIAEKLGIALPTVKVHYYKALKTLRKLKDSEMLLIVLILHEWISVLY